MTARMLRSTGFAVADAENDFLRARRHHTLTHLARSLRIRSNEGNELLSFDEVIAGSGLVGTTDLGLQTVALDSILGSVDRRRDFDGHFYPTSDRARERWQRVALAYRRGQAMPPVSLYRVGDVHFVQDGHHRVSVARAGHQKMIDAYVVEVRTRTRSADPRATAGNRTLDSLMAIGLREGRAMAAPGGQSDDKAVAVVGAGIMGSAMARRLLAAGLPVTVWDRSSSATDPLAEAGAVVAGSPEEAVRDARVLITMLPTADVVSSVIFDGGVAEAFPRSCVWVQMGTIGVEATIAIGDRLRALRPDVLFVDSPVSGSKGPAEQGQLLILASGPAGAEEVVAPIFAAIGRKTVWLGEAGQGSRMKLVVNAYMSILIQGVAEALELADRLDIGHQQLEDVIEGGPLDAPIADAKLHKMDEGDFAPEFPLQWALKDVDLAIDAAHGDDLPLLAALSRQWHVAVDAGHGRQDISAARLALKGTFVP